MEKRFTPPKELRKHKINNVVLKDVADTLRFIEIVTSVLREMKVQRDTLRGTIQIWDKEEGVDYYKSYNEEGEVRLFLRDYPTSGCSVRIEGISPNSSERIVVTGDWEKGAEGDASRYLAAWSESYDAGLQADFLDKMEARWEVRENTSNKTVEEQDETYALRERIEELEEELRKRQKTTVTCGKHRIGKKRKTDFVKVISAMYELGIFETENGKTANNKLHLMEDFGVFLGEDLSTYSVLLSSSKRNKGFMDVFESLSDAGKKDLSHLVEELDDKERYLEIFKDLKIQGDRYYNEQDSHNKG